MDDKILIKKLTLLYGSRSEEVYTMIHGLINNSERSAAKSWISENDVMLITYGDSIKKIGERPLVTLNNFLNKYGDDAITSVHLLPMFPFTSDDGFSVVDYRKISDDLGTWEDIDKLASNYNLMFDAVINHISKSSEWFQGYLNGDDKYSNFFIECSDDVDYSMVTRPRALPLFYDYESNQGTRKIWATFSEDQVDINFQNPRVLMEILDILIMYSRKGSKYIRFDAIGFAWKKLGTTCMHLEETHALVQIMRHVLDIVVPGTIIITETNVPHMDNISYFGNGHNEAQMVYQFPLPPLVLFSFITGDTSKLSEWADSLKDTPLTSDTTYFNFLASHDGIGMRPTEGILSDKERQIIVANTINNGGKINYKNNSDGSKSPYELNINYLDALTNTEASDEERILRMLASQVILISVVGVPGIYIHSLLGSRNWYKGVEESGINRRINREKLDVDLLVREIESDIIRSSIFSEYKRLINIRKERTAFSPFASQEVLFLDKRVFAFIRENRDTMDKVLVLVNVTDDIVELSTNFVGTDIINDEQIKEIIKLEKYQCRWVSIE